MESNLNCLVWSGRGGERVHEGHRQHQHVQGRPTYAQIYVRAVCPKIKLHIESFYC